jgi:hypothetical protein
LVHVKITEDGLVVVSGNAQIEKSAFSLPNYPELDQPKHKNGGWAITIGYLQIAEPFYSEVQREEFARGFEHIRNRTIGRTKIQQVWLIHYANRTLSHIIGKVPFVLGGSNSLTAEQLLERLEIDDRRTSRAEKNIW